MTATATRLDPPKQAAPVAPPKPTVNPKTFKLIVRNALVTATIMLDADSKDDAVKHAKAMLTAGITVV